MQKIYTINELTLLNNVLDNRYKIKSFLAKGSSSTNIYLAFDLLLEHYVAIKIIYAYYDIKIVNQFLQESKTGAILKSSPYIVKVLNYGHSKSFVYLVMEYIKGWNLRDFLNKQSSITIEKTVYILEKILLGVINIHTSNIIHRDLKPENILMSINGLIKITDFGLAHVDDKRKISKQSIFGTIAYMAPELICKGKSSKSSDIYALGIILHEMITGSRPFYPNRSIKQISYIRKKISSLSDILSEKIIDLICQCIEKNSTYRVKDATTMLQKIQDIKLIIEHEKNCKIKKNIKILKTSFLKKISDKIC